VTPAESQDDAGARALELQRKATSRTPGNDDAKASAPPVHPAWLALRRLAGNMSALTGAALVILVLFMAATADILSPYGIDDTSGAARARPSWAHWLGTDENTKDVLSRVMHGSRISLTSGMAAIVLAMLAGVPAGAIAGYAGGYTDAAIMRTVDVALSFPAILIAMLAAAAFEPGWTTIVFAVALVNTSVFARQVRVTVLTAKELEYVLASRALGASNWRILTSHILPSVINPVVVLATLGLGAAILEVAGLSFLGIGGDPTAPEWGRMLTQAKNDFRSNPYFAIGPAAAISMTILGFNLLGDGLRDALDPRLPKA